jgi:methionyl aminopeptidase
MIAAGDWDAEILMDGWTAITKDRSLAAHYEQTVALTDRGVEILSVDEEEASRGHLLKEQPYA